MFQREAHQLRRTGKFRRSAAEIARAHSAMGNAAEALRAYEHCRKLIASELGVDPSPQTMAEYENLLQSL